ncbi:M24 family metallopeptidase [Roseomonas sp. BN140053]|uniref:M24 family metallopeptidase n=1 Tax=Roseomonas sp. BN140053 TaxID=3391898 RepID=UPI0039EB07DE
MSGTERITTRVSDAELERRWAAARAAMAERGLDALVMQNTNDWLGGHVKWFTDIPANNGYPRTVVFHAEEPMTVVEMGAFGVRRDLEGRDPIHRGVGEHLFTPSFFSIPYTLSYDAELALGALRAHGARRVGLVGAGALPAALTDALRREYPGEALADATEAVDRIKAIKSEEEVALIRRTAALQDAVFAKVLEGIRPGMRDVELTALAQREAQVLGSEQGIFLGSSAPLGVRAGFQSRHMQGRTIQAGEHFSLLIEVNGPGGFYTEIARTVVLGRASAEVLDGFAAVKAAQDHTLGLLRPGVPCRDVAAAHDAYMQARGLPPEIRLYCHGQGYDMVERPLIRADESWEIAAGMCLAVHPGYETPSLFAVICDNYMIGADGPGACLHATEKKVFEI